MRRCHYGPFRARHIASLALDSATRPLRARRVVEETARILAVYPENAATMRLPMVGAAPDCGVATTQLPEIDATFRLTAIAADDAATSRLPEVTLTVGPPTIALPTVVRRAPADVAVCTPAPHVERTLLDVVESTAALRPGAPALDAGTPLTYRDMLARVDRVAGMLQACGVRAGDRVGVRMSSGTADLYLGILGVLAAGAAYVPVDADDPEERAATIWEEANVCGVLTDGMRFLARRGPGSWAEAGCGSVKPRSASGRSSGTRASSAPATQFPTTPSSRCSPTLPRMPSRTLRGWDGRRCSSRGSPRPSTRRARSTRLGVSCSPAR